MLNVLSVLLILVGFISLIVFSIIWIAKKVVLRNTSKGKHGQYALYSFGVIVLAVILFNFTDTDTATVNTKKTNSSYEAHVTEMLNSDLKEKDVVKKESTPIEAKEKAEVKDKKEEVEKKLADEQRIAAEMKAIEEKAAQEKANKEKEATQKNTGDSASTLTGLIPVTLVKTIDGDTIKIKYEGKEQNVRYLLVDTPETSHPQLGKQPFGEQAKERNRALVNSGKLSIEFDVGQRVDKYGRLLAYVYVDGVNINEKLVEEGLARVGYVYPPNTRHLTKFEEAQKRAKAKRIGIWSIEDYATDSGFKGTVSAPNNSGSTANSSSSKGSGGSTATPTPPKPPAAAPSTTEAKELFQNCTELRKKYPNGVASTHPAYQLKMDRDKDRFACER